MRTLHVLGLALLVGCSSSSAPADDSRKDAASDVVPIVLLPLPDAGHPAPRHDAAPPPPDAHPEASNDGAADAPAGTVYPAVHPAMPQVVSAGGPVMKAPKFVVITFAGDTLIPSIDDFVAKVAASQTYWSGTTAEYGVGPIASVTNVTLTETPATTLQDSDVQAWLMQKLTGASADAGALEAGAHDGGTVGSAVLPPPDGDTVYMIYYPSTTTVTLDGGESCNAFYGYHNDFNLAGSSYVTYSVVARCPPFPSTSAIDSLAAIASHEMIEAVTDPQVADNPAYLQPDLAHLAWAVPAGGELGDMCAGYGNVFYTPTDVPYLVQRSWSNKAAAAGHDPCQPDGATPYFNAAAVLTQTLTVNDPMLGMYSNVGLKIPVGGSATIDLDLYSDGPTSGPFTVTASDLSSLFGGPAELDVSFGGQATATGVNGQTVQMTVKVLSAGSGNAEILWIQSELGAVHPVWIGLITN